MRATPLLIVLCATSAPPLTAQSSSGDSTGVPIVHNPDPATAGVPGWNVSARPVLELGAGDQPAEIFDRIAGVVRLSDGHTVVADGGSAEIRVFDADGRHRRTFGREGRGPGEFTALRGLFRLPGDSLLAWDPLDDEALVFTPDGTLARTIDIGRPDGSFGVNIRGVLSDGKLFAPASVVVTNPPHGVVHQGEATFHIFGPDGGHVAAIGPFRASDMYSPPVEARGNVAMALPDLPFRREISAAVAGSTVAIGRSDQWSIRVFDASGDPLRIIRSAHTPEPVRDRDRDAYIRQALDLAAERARPALRRFFADAPVPETLPAFERIVGADDGSLWISHYPRPDDATVRWSVFGPDGRIVATAATPADFRLLSVEGDLLIGTARAELDVEHVRVYRVQRSGG